METISGRCESCGTFDDTLIPFDGEWSFVGMCPKCFADIPASEDCDVCSEVVERNHEGLLDLFVLVMDRDDQVIGYRHPWCDVEKQLEGES